MKPFSWNYYNDGLNRAPSHVVTSWSMKGETLSHHEETAVWILTAEIPFTLWSLLKFSQTICNLPIRSINNIHSPYDIYLSEYCNVMNFLLCTFSSVSCWTCFVTLVYSSCMITPCSCCRNSISVVCRERFILEVFSTVFSSSFIRWYSSSHSSEKTKKLIWTQADSLGEVDNLWQK